MIDISKIDYSLLDRPEILRSLFYPRPEISIGPETPGTDVLIPVEEGVAVGARFHIAARSAPNILFFHGNGEIVSDYDGMGPVYNRMGLNFLPVDYRGYGRSTGRPTITAMMRDCHVILEFVIRHLRDDGYSGPLIVMGRSLGSASALELAASCSPRIDGLIIESGFAYAVPLLRLLGIDPHSLGLREEQGFRNVEKIRAFDKPTLIIHAELDQIIPFSDAQALFDASPADRKELVKIPHATHNDLFLRDLTRYLSAVKKLAERVSSTVQGL